MKYLQIIFFCILILYNFPSLSAESSDNSVNKVLELDINNVIALALKNNLDIERQKSETDFQTWIMGTSWNDFIPEISLLGNLTNVDKRQESDWFEYVGYPDFFIPIKKYSPKYLWSLEVAFNLQFQLNIAAFFDVYQKILDWKKGKLEYDSVCSRIIRDTKKEFYNLLLLKRKHDLTLENLQLVEKKYEHALLRFEQNKISELEKINIQIDYQSLKQLLKEDKEVFSTGMVQYKFFIGIDSDKTVELKGDFSKFYDEYTRLKNKNLDYSNNLELKKQELSKSVNKNTMNTAISALLPRFRLSYYYDLRFKEDLTVTPLFEAGENYDRHWEHENGRLTFSLSLPLNTWLPLAKEQVDIIKSRYNIRQSEVLYQKMSFEKKMLVRKLINTIESTMEKINNLQLHIDLAEKAYILAQEQYTIKKIDIIALEEAGHRLRKMNYDLDKEKYIIYSHIFDLDYVLNKYL